MAMKKLTATTFEPDGEGDWFAEDDLRWLRVRGSERNGFRAVAFWIDWGGSHSSSQVDSKSGFATIGEALDWGAQALNDAPLRLACEALETAFETMAEWLPHVAPLLAAARAEAALAEREACVSALDAEIAALEALGDEHDQRGTTVVGWRIKSVRAARDAIRARTTPATLSSDTLAAIAEARGLRVVEPERLAELEAAANASGGKDGAK